METPILEFEELCPGLIYKLDIALLNNEQFTQDEREMIIEALTDYLLITT